MVALNGCAAGGGKRERVISALNDENGAGKGARESGSYRHLSQIALPAFRDRKRSQGRVKRFGCVGCCGGALRACVGSASGLRHLCVTSKVLGWKGCVTCVGCFADFNFASVGWGSRSGPGPGRVFGHDEHDWGTRWTRWNWGVFVCRKVDGYGCGMKLGIENAEMDGVDADAGRFLVLGLFDGMAVPFLVGGGEVTGRRSLGPEVQMFAGRSGVF